MAGVSIETTLELWAPACAPRLPRDDIFPAGLHDRVGDGVPHQGPPRK